MDYDAIIVGAGPAGLSAGAALARAGRRVLCLDRESFGGQVMNTEWVEDYPAPGERIAGPALGSQFVEAAAGAGAELELGEVTEIETYSGCRSVTCADGKTWTANAVIIAGGLRPKKLGLPAEDRLGGRGVIHCAFCDAGLYANRAVAVCGGGHAGLVEALLLAKHASRVHLLESQPALSAPPELQARARAEPKLDIRCGHRVAEIAGKDSVSAVVIENVASGARERLEVHGLLARVGFEAPTEYLLGVAPLGEAGCIEVLGDMRTEAPGIFAAGDIRCGSPRRAAAAVADGVRAAAAALAFLQSPL
ncbi:MAG: FAD-dependent oxidoreductase [Burkholderiales bacterium]|nr:FAD-dependent oxidoreductase [Burkholderiales bacterium]